MKKIGTFALFALVVALSAAVCGTAALGVAMMVVAVAVIAFGGDTVWIGTAVSPAFLACWFAAAGLVVGETILRERKMEINRALEKERAVLQLSQVLTAWIVANQKSES